MKYTKVIEEAHKKEWKDYTELLSQLEANTGAEDVKKDLGPYLCDIEELVEYVRLEKKGYIKDSKREFIGHVINCSSCNISYYRFADLLVQIINSVEDVKYEAYYLRKTATITGEYSGIDDCKCNRYYIFILPEEVVERELDLSDPDASDKLINLYDQESIKQRGIKINVHQYDDVRQYEVGLLIQNIVERPFDNYCRIEWYNKIEIPKSLDYLKDFFKLITARQYKEDRYFSKEELASLAAEYIEDKKANQKSKDIHQKALHMVNPENQN